MELEEWIAAYATGRLIIRMELTSFASNPHPGNESVRASLIRCVRTEQGALMAHAIFERTGGAAVGGLYINTEDDPTEFVGFVKRSVISHWEQRRDHSWYDQTETVFQLKTSSGWDGIIQHLALHASNTLVLQHLARIQGAIGEASAKSGDSRMPVLDNMAQVLGAIIAQGNKELARLTQMG